MNTIKYNLVTNQNSFKPLLAKEYKLSGKSNSNKLRPEACPAVFQGSSRGILFFSEQDFFLPENCDHTVYVYKTKNKHTGKIGNEIITPALLGSSENEPGYYKIGNGLNIKLGEVGALILPPIDPRLKDVNLDYSIAYLPPHYSGQLVAAIKPLNDTQIKAGAVIGQLIPLSEEKISLVEEEFENNINHFENDFLIIDDKFTKTTAFNFHENR